MAQIHLEEAQFWGEKRDKDVRVLAVGLGTGVWAPTVKTIDSFVLSIVGKSNYPGSWCAADQF